jgi:hypothetical protein
MTCEVSRALRILIHLDDAKTISRAIVVVDEPFAMVHMTRPPYARRCHVSASPDQCPSPRKPPAIGSPAGCSHVAAAPEPLRARDRGTKAVTLSWPRLAVLEVSAGRGGRHSSAARPSPASSRPRAA